MCKQKIDDYFKMLGEVFEWICYESDDEVELSAVRTINGEHCLKPDYFTNNTSALCIGTIMSACRAYDNKYKTDYFTKFMYAREHGLDHSR